MKIIWTFTLLMIPGVLSSISVTGYSGGGVSITCRYDRGYTDNKKYFCRGQNPVTPQIGWCSDLIKTEEKVKWVDSGRFSLYDDTRAAVFTVTIRDLSEQDSGTYQCAVDISLYGDFFTEVNLKVVTEATEVTANDPSQDDREATTAVTATCPSQDVREGSSLTIGLSVAAVLIIIGLVSFTVIYCMRRKTQDPNSASKMPKPGTGNIETVPQTGFIYEEIADTRPHTDPDTGTKTVYATAQIPTNPSDSTKTVYATSQLPTTPSDSTKTVYATSQLPTTPSDSTKTVYATPQLPTNPSDSTKTVYATPQLPTNPSD